MILMFVILDLLTWLILSPSMNCLELLTFVQNFSKAIKAAAIELVVGELNDTYYYLERNARAKILHLDLSITSSRMFRI